LLPPRRQERQVRKFNFFAAFAPLREIFRFLVAASPRGASVVKISSHETRKNLLFVVRVFVPCGQFTVPHLAELEADIGAPVVAATYAHIWAGLRMINVRAKITGHGKLLQTLGNEP
jgi:hypothetical protein